jgi:hypothetical protein
LDQDITSFVLSKVEATQALHVETNDDLGSRLEFNIRRKIREREMVDVWSP